MILTRKMLDTRYAWWFHGKRNTELAKEEILRVFSSRNRMTDKSGPSRIFTSSPERSLPAGITPD